MSKSSQSLCKGVQCKRCKDIGRGPFSHGCGDEDDCQWLGIEIYPAESMSNNPEEIQPYIADALDAVSGDVSKENFKKAVSLILKNWQW